MTNRIRFTAANQITETFESAAEIIGVELGDEPPLETLRKLHTEEDPTPAVAFTCFALPKREAIWWGCLCLRALGGLDRDGQAALAATEAWVRKPDDAERREAGRLALEQEFENPGAVIAQAAFVSGGSLAPAEFEKVPPQQDLTAKCLFGAIRFAAALGEPVEIPDRLRKCVASAIDFCDGGDGQGPWKGSGGA